MLNNSSKFVKSKLFILWLIIVGLCLATTLFTHFEMGQTIRSFLQDGDIQLTSIPSGAQVILNRKNIGLTPLHKKVRAGTYDVILQRGTWEIPRDVTVKVHVTSQVSVRFNYASINFTSQVPGIDVAIDGARTGTIPFTASEMQPGAHTIEYHQGNNSISEVVVVDEGDKLQREISFELFQSVIRDGDRIIRTEPTPPVWIGVWTGHVERFANSKESKPAVSKLQVNPDLKSGTLIEHLGFLPIEVPVAISATGARLEAHGMIQSGDTTYMADCVLTHIPGQSQAAVEITRHYFYLNTETNSKTSSGTMDKVSGL
jgi:PEGA domain